MKTKKQKIVIVLCVLLSLVLLEFVLRGGVSYVSAYPSAHREYVKLQGTNGMRDCIANIKYGMKRSEVHKILQHAQHAFTGLPGSSPGWDGSVDIYVFNYGKPWHTPFRIDSSIFGQYVFQEEYIIYYNTDGQAVKLEKVMLSGRDHNVTHDLPRIATDK